METLEIFAKENNLIITWSATSVITNSSGAGTFTITDKKLYFLVVILLINDTGKLMQQLKPSFKRTINWNKYQPIVAIERQNQYSDYLIDSTFHWVNRLLILSFENNDDKTEQTRYFLPKV